MTIDTTTAIRERTSTRDWIMLGVGLGTVGLAAIFGTTFYCVSCMAPAFG